MLCAKFGWNWLSGSGEEDFLISSMYFHYFVIISLWKGAGPFIQTNLNPFYPRMLCAKFGWNWPSGSGEEDENVKSLQTDRRTDRQRTDERWSEKLTWAFSSGELKTTKEVRFCRFLYSTNSAISLDKIICMSACVRLLEIFNIQLFHFHHVNLFVQWWIHFAQGSLVPS